MTPPDSLTRSQPIADALRHALASAIDSPTVGKLADVFGKNAKLTKSYSEQIVDILLPRLVALSAPAVATGEPVAWQVPIDRERFEKLIQRHASAYVARGAAISENIIAECKASREALLAALPPAKVAGDVRTAAIEPKVLVEAIKTADRAFGPNNLSAPFVEYLASAIVRALAQAPATDVAGGQHD